MLASECLTRVQGTLDFDRSAIGVAGLESTNLLAVLNSAVKEYFASFEKSGEPQSTVEKEVGYTLVADTTLDGAVVEDAATVTLTDSSSFGASGAIAIWDNDRPDYVKFGANDLSTILSTVTGIDFGHEDNDTVSLLYALPSDYDSMRSEQGYEDGVSVDGSPFFFTSGDPEGSKYAIYDDGTTKYLHFPRGRTGDVFVRYNAAPTTIDEETDTIPLPAKDEDYCVWKVTEYCALKLEQADIYNQAKTEAFNILHSAHARRNIGKRPRTRPMRRHGRFTRYHIFG